MAARGTRCRSNRSRRRLNRSDDACVAVRRSPVPWAARPCLFVFSPSNLHHEDTKARSSLKPLRAFVSSWFKPNLVQDETLQRAARGTGLDARCIPLVRPRPSIGVLRVVLVV